MKGWNKELILLGATIAILILSALGLESWHKEKIFSLRGKKVEALDFALSAPSFLEEGELIWKDGGRNIFLEPGELLELPPLEFEPPPLPALSALAPPPQPRPAPGFWNLLRRNFPEPALDPVEEEEGEGEALRGGEESAGQAKEEGESSEGEEKTGEEGTEEVEEGEVEMTAPDRKSVV